MNLQIPFVKILFECGRRTGAWDNKSSNNSIIEADGVIIVLSFSSLVLPWSFNCSTCLRSFLLLRAFRLSSTFTDILFE